MKFPILLLSKHNLCTVKLTEEYYYVNPKNILKRKSFFKKLSIIAKNVQKTFLEYKTFVAPEISKKTEQT